MMKNEMMKLQELLKTWKGGVMRSYTEEAIKDKFERILRRIDEDKQLFILLC